MNHVKIEPKPRKVELLADYDVEDEIVKYGVIRNSASLLELDQATTFDSLEGACAFASGLSTPGKWVVVEQVITVSARYEVTTQNNQIG